MSAKATRTSVMFSSSTAFVLDSGQWRKPYSNQEQLLLQSDRGIQQTSHPKSSLNTHPASPDTIPKEVGAP